MLTHMAHIIFTDARKKLNGVAICTAECRIAWIRNIWTRCGVRWSSRAYLPHSFTVAEQGPLYGRVQASILCTMFFIGLVHHHHHHHYHYHKGKVATYRYGITVELHVFVALVAAAGVVPLRFHSICCHRLECANGSGKTKGCSKRTNHLIAEKNTLVFFHRHAQTRTTARSHFPAPLGQHRSGFPSNGERFGKQNSSSIFTKFCCSFRGSRDHHTWKVMMTEPILLCCVPVPTDWRCAYERKRKTVEHSPTPKMYRVNVQGG